MNIILVMSDVVNILERSTRGGAWSIAKFLLNRGQFGKFSDWVFTQSAIECSQHVVWNSTHLCPRSKRMLVSKYVTFRFQRKKKKYSCTFPSLRFNRIQNITNNCFFKKHLMTFFSDERVLCVWRHLGPNRRTKWHHAICGFSDLISLILKQTIINYSFLFDQDALFVCLLK